MVHRRDESKGQLRGAGPRIACPIVGAAGLLDEGMTLAQKREMAQFLSLSVTSAQEEESQRKDRELEEEKLMEETLNSSINANKELQDDSDNSRGSDIVIISDSQSSRSSRISKGIVGLDRSQNTEKSSKPPSPSHSDQDMFCDSQVEKQVQDKHVTTPVREKGFEKKISTTSADSASESSRNRLENIQKTYANVTSRQGIRKHPTVDEISSPSNKALRRHATVHEVSSPSTKVQHNVDTVEKVPSQSLFSSGSSNISIRGDKILLPTMDTDEDTQLFSPLIGGRKVINGRTVSALERHKSSNVQESQISNSLEVVKLHSEKTSNDDDSSTDDEIISSPVESVSIIEKPSTPAGVLGRSRMSAASTPNTSNVNLRLSISPGISPAKSPAMGKSLVQSAVDEEEDDDATQEIDVIPSVSSTDKSVASSENKNILTHQLDKDSENSSDANDNFSYSIDWKKSVKVFPLSKPDTVSLQRKNMRSEKRSLSYMKHENESVNESKRRIISLIDTSCNILEKYQESLGYRLRWALPVIVDKRVKEWSLLRPQQTIKKILPTSKDEEEPGIRRATRQARKIQEQNTGGDSDDSLPNIIPNSQDPNMTSKLKPSSQGSLVDVKYSNNDEKCRLVNDDTDDDLDDFNIFPSKHSKQLGKTAVELADSTPRKHPKLSRDVDCVSSSRVQEDIKNSSKERKINFELNVSDSDNDNDKKELVSDDNYINSPKRKPNENFEELRPIKRRKTFMLTVEEDEVASSSTISDSLQKQKIMESSCDTEVSSVVDEVDERNKKLFNSKLTEEIEGLHSSQEQKKETNFVSSSYEESHDVGNPGPSSSSGDLFILENTDAKVMKDDQSTNNTAADTRVDSKSRQRGVQIRPARLKLSGRRNNGKRRDGPNEDGDQISSSLEQSDHEKLVRIYYQECSKIFQYIHLAMHAATCDGQVDSTVEEAVEDERTLSSGPSTDAPVVKEDTSMRRPIAATAPEKRPRTPPNAVRCYLCDDVFPEGDEYGIHVPECDGQRKMVDGIKSPSSTASPNTWVTKRVQRGANQIKTYSKIKTIVKPRSVFDQLEGSGPSRSRTPAPPRIYEEMQEGVAFEETNDSDDSEDSEDYDFPDSPIRSFVPISQQTDAEINYHNQFRDKTRKVAGGAPSKKKRKRKSNRGRGKTRKKSKS
ncbi:unnamed protein product, partial [Meganyctiphanes norvegica]